MLIETGGTTDVAGVVVESVKIGGGCETPMETDGHGAIEIRVEMVTVGDGTETISTKSLKIGTDTEISTVTSGVVEIGYETSG